MPKKPSRSVLAALSASDLSQELRRRKLQSSRIRRKRDTLLKKVAALEAELAEIGELVGGGGSRPRNEQTLPDALAAVFKGKTMSVVQAAEAVQKAGYRTSAANFRVIVNATVIKDKRFKRVARGQYTLA